MVTSSLIQNILSFTKLILPHQAYKETLLDLAPEKLPANIGEKVLRSLGVSVVTSQRSAQEANSDIVIDFTKHFIAHSDYEHAAYHYISNPDGSMRWVFPVTLKSPTFLSFYTISSWKTRLRVFGLRCAFYTGLQRMAVTGTFHLYTKNKPYFTRFLRPGLVENFSIFMGTVGPNRKIIIELNKYRQTTHFVKIALTEASSSLLKNEFLQLDNAEDLGLEHTVVPHAFLFGEERALMQPSLYTSECARSTTWTIAHTIAKLEMEEKSISRTAISEFLAPMHTKLSVLCRKEDLPHQLKKLTLMTLATIEHVTKATSLLPVTFCHNDFTPWNIYIEGNKLKVYDWELADTGPALSDVFHFHLQKGVMLDQSSYSSISNEIKKVLDQPVWREFIQRQQLDIPFQFSIYLIQTISYYLELYGRQPKLHWQADALLHVWETALEETMAWQNPVSFRKQFIPAFFEELQNKSYACLKFIYGHPEALPESSDIDILISKSDLQTTLSFTALSPLVKKVKTVRKSFMTTLHVFFKDGSFLSIDLITSFRRTHFVMMDALEVLSKRQMVNGIYRPEPNHDFEYMFLFYQLNRSSVPERYCRHFYELHTDVQKNVQKYISIKYGLNDRPFLAFLEFDEQLRSEIIAAISYSRDNVGFHAIYNRYLYLKDTVRDLWANQGFTLTVSGVDGAGKSTVIGEVKQLLETKYRKKVVVLRHRPSVLPILSAWVYGKETAEQRSVERLPRTGTNHHRFKSLLRFGYYMTDYLVGQFYIQMRYILRGKVVIYDRYYFDFINDARRSNISIHPSIPRALYAFVHKPQLNVFLYAPASEILKRKQELKKHEIEELTLSYKTLFADLAAKDNKHEYLSILNLHLKETLVRIEASITRIA